MRLFIAIQLSDEMKKALVACMHDLKKQGVEGNYVPAQNLHMTLAFIGEYESEGSDRESPSSGVQNQPVGERKFRQYPVGGRQGKPEAENLCEGSAGRPFGRGNPL